MLRVDKDGDWMYRGGGGTSTHVPWAGWVPGGDGEPEPPGLSPGESGLHWVTSRFFEEDRYGRYRVPHVLGNCSSSDQSGSSLFSPWHLSNLLHPHLSVCGAAASPGQSNQVRSPECPWRQGGGGLWGCREKGETGSWGRIMRGRGKRQCSENARLFCYRGN